MDDLLGEFLTETNESLDVVDVELIKFEQDPNNAEILGNIFRLVHTIKGTCGFLGLPRLASLAHAAETLMGKYRDGAQVTENGVSLILKTIDRIKELLASLETTGHEPEGDDSDLISALDAISNGQDGADANAVANSQEDKEEALPLQVLERELKPGEVSLEELERAFLEAEGPELPVEKKSSTKEMNSGDDEAAGKEKSVNTKAAESSKTEAPKEEKLEPAKSKPALKKPSMAGDKSEQRGEGGTEGGGVKSQSIRVNVDTLEHLMTMVSELVLTRNQLLEIARHQEENGFKVPLQRLSNVTAELQEGVMKTRMQPIGNAWQKLPRIVRDLAHELNKDIELEMNGAETELDRQVLELIKDPLTHMVRNSGDHGLETREERLQVGKSEKGKIILSAYHEGGHIIIEISDDGRGLNTDVIRQKVIEKGMLSETEAEKLPDNQLFKYIFAPGFSTAKAVTSVSGRGVGMDVVRTNIEVIGGSIDLRSKRGAGTTVTIKIPLTLAIVSALIVECDGNRFAIPQLSVMELVRVRNSSDHQIEFIKNTPVLRLRNKLLPLIDLGSMLGTTESKDGDALDIGGFIVVIQVGHRTFGLIVDSVFHSEEIVVKPMSSKLKNIPLFSGITILGDGSVIMIVDPNGIAKLNQSTEAVEEENKKQAVISASEIQTVQSFLLFKAGSAEPKAVPLSLITRLEEVPVEGIERSNGRDLVQYRGSLMPLVYVNKTTKLHDEGSQPLIVFSDEGRSMGLVVDEIVDIVEDRLDIQVSSEQPGLLGSAVIKGKATEVVDVGYFLPQAFEDWFHRKEKSAMVNMTKRLLFVDDSSFFRNMLGPVLKAAGYEVVICDSAPRALEVLSREKDFNVIVSDIEMPKMNGFEFAEAVRSDDELRHIPIIALSSLVVQSALERGRQAGFHDYVAKFDRPGLIAALKETENTNTGVAA